MNQKRIPQVKDASGLRRAPSLVRPGCFYFLKLRFHFREDKDKDLLQRLKQTHGRDCLTDGAICRSERGTATGLQSRNALMAPPPDSGGPAGLGLSSQSGGSRRTVPSSMGVNHEPQPSQVTRCLLAGVGLSLSGSASKTRGAHEGRGCLSRGVTAARLPCLPPQKWQPFLCPWPCP